MMTSFVLVRRSAINISSVPSALKVWRFCSGSGRSSCLSRNSSRLNVRHPKKPQVVNQRRAEPLFKISAVFNSKSSAGPAVYMKDARLNNENLGSKEERQKSLDDETIAAIVTAMGGQDGAVAIVRLSGTSAVEIVGRLFQPARRVRHERTSHSNWEWTP